MKYSRILIAIGTLVLILIIIGRCHNGGDNVERPSNNGGGITEHPSNEVDKLLKEKISLLNQATDILYNERTPEGKEKLKKIHAAETELGKKIATLPDAKRREFDNNPELKVAIERLEKAKRDIEIGF